MSRGINGWSRAAAASLYATLGEGDNAIEQIHGHMTDRRIKSLAGESCRVQAAFASPPQWQINRNTIALKPAVHGVYELPLAKWDEALLFTGGQPSAVVNPLPGAPQACNSFGLPKTN